jgi:ABC-type transport system involved in multi-copper enzyme maturation permease subunit
LNTLALVWIAETRKLLSRTAAKVGLLAAVAIGVLGPVSLELLSGGGITVNGGELELDVSAANAVRWALVLRGFFVAQGFLALLAAVSLAGEMQAHTLREDLVRPVARQVVLLAKWGALVVWSAVWLLVQGSVATGVGLLLHAAEGGASWSDVALGYAAAWASDVSFAAVALACAAVLRSPTSALLALLLGVLLERFVAWVLWAVAGVALGSAELPGWATAILHAAPYLPSAAWSVWSDVASGAASPAASWVGLAGWTVIAVVVAERSFAASDIP